MTFRSLFERLSAHEGLNFALTNLIPRRTASRLVGWLSRIEQPLVRDVLLQAFRFFCEPDLDEARKRSFTSLRDCFVRELVSGARPIDPRESILTSPCDAIVGACGRIERGTLMQVKGSAYPLAELLRDPALAAAHDGGLYATLRLTAGMYHRFHAPHRCRMVSVAHIAGDAWNVNPPTLSRVARVYCRNERAILQLRLDDDSRVTLVPVAAILVAGIRLHEVALPSDRTHRDPWIRSCDVAFGKGAEMGWFEHGSTIVVLTGPGFSLSERASLGTMIRMGEALMHLPQGLRPAGVAEPPPHRNGIVASRS